MSKQPERQVTVNGETFTEVKAAYEMSIQICENLTPGLLAQMLESAQKSVDEHDIKPVNFSWVENGVGAPCLRISGRGWERKAGT